VRGRGREIGIRTALGVSATDVLRLVIVEGMSPTPVGIAVGTIAAVTSAKVMATLVFGVCASDPQTLAAVAATLALVALMARLVPAYRALRLDPVKVLRAGRDVCPTAALLCIRPKAPTPVHIRLCRDGRLTNGKPPLNGR
jgi:putative ABC transport system permease protein